MASMFMSNFMMFLPEKTQWFCAVGLAVFVFGIWIPYEERKKKKKPKNPQKKPEPVERIAEDRRKLEQLKALKKAGILSEEEYQKEMIAARTKAE